MRSRSASVVSAKKRRAIVSSFRSGPAACSAIQARSIRFWAIKPIADSMSEPVQSPSRLNTPRPISSASSGFTSPIASASRARAAEPEPDLGAAGENPPVIGELLDDPQPPAAVSAWLSTRRKHSVPLVGYLDSHRVCLGVNPERDRSDAMQHRVGDQLGHHQNSVSSLLRVERRGVAVHEPAGGADRIRRARQICAERVHMWLVEVEQELARGLVPLGLTRSNEAATRTFYRGHNEPGATSETAPASTVLFHAANTTPTFGIRDRRRSSRGMGLPPASAAV